MVNGWRWQYRYGTSGYGTYSRLSPSRMALYNFSLLRFWPFPFLALQQDKEIDNALYKVRFFMAPPTALMTPYLLSKVLLFTIRKKLGVIQS